MKIASSEHVVYINCFVFTFKLVNKSMNNLLSYCGLVEPRISASDKDLPVKKKFVKKTSNGKEMNELE